MSEGEWRCAGGVFLVFVLKLTTEGADGDSDAL